MKAKTEPETDLEYPEFMNMSVWKKSIELLLKIYELTKSFPILDEIIQDCSEIVNELTALIISLEKKVR